MRRWAFRGVVFLLATLFSLPLIAAESSVVPVQWPQQWVVFLPLTRDDALPSPEAFAAVPQVLEVSGKRLEARSITPDAEGTFDFTPLLGEVREGNTAYAFLEIEADGPQEVTLGFGADWWLQAWLNGEPILDTLEEGNGSWPPMVNDHTVDVVLKPGHNVLAVRLITGTGSSLLAVGWSWRHWDTAILQQIEQSGRAVDQAERGRILNELKERRSLSAELREALGAPYDTISEQILRQIKQAGNTQSEQERYRILNELKDHPDVPPLLGHDFDTVLPIVDWWANGRDKAAQGTGELAAKNGYLWTFFDWKARPGNDWPGKMLTDSPLYPVWAYYRARALLWMLIEYGTLLTNRDVREPWVGESLRLLHVAAEAYPDNPIIAMYTGKPMPWPNDFENDPCAPEWANLQREGLEKLTELIHWWIDHRQLPDGQFGGRWDDDVEMWRWWTGVLVGFDDPKINAAQARLSRGIFNTPLLAQGYTAKMTDVEHSAEDVGDSIIPMMFLDPDNAEWREHTSNIVAHARNTWMGLNERGFVQFKSTWFNVYEVDFDPKRACDTVYHARVLLPAMLYWQRTGDTAVGNLITRWMDTWVDVTARQENGKPAGVMPSVIHWPDGQAGGGVEPWWRPQNVPSDTIYHWPSSMPGMLKSLLLTYHQTGDEKYLEPIRSMARIRQAYLAESSNQEPVPGSLAWCASKMRFLVEPLSKYRLLTGSDVFDDLLIADAGGYLKYRLTGQMDSLIQELRNNAEAFRINKPGYTDEMRWTDRVLKFNERWGNHGNNWNWPMPLGRLQVLYSSATGDPGTIEFFAMNAVRWLTEPRGIAALVTDASTERFSASLYHFGEQPRAMQAELYLLKPGHYEMTLTNAPGQQLKIAEFDVTGPRTRIDFQLPSRILCELQIKPISAVSDS